MIQVAPVVMKRQMYIRVATAGTEPVRSTWRGPLRGRPPLPGGSNTVFRDRVWALTAGRTMVVALAGLLWMIPAGEDASAVPYSPDTNAPAVPFTCSTNPLSSAAEGDVSIQTWLDATNAVSGLNEANSRLSPLWAVNVLVSSGGKRRLDVGGQCVTSSGELPLPLVGRVKADGLTLSELTAQLQKLYGDALSNPDVVVELTTAGRAQMTPANVVTVMGAVRSPGSLTVPGDRSLTVKDAIQRSGGLNPSAQDARIRLTRRNPDGSVLQKDVDLRALAPAEQLSPLIVLQPGDIVYIPEEGASLVPAP